MASPNISSASGVATNIAALNADLWVSLLERPDLDKRSWSGAILAAWRHARRWDRSAMRTVDWAILGVYMAFVLGIGVIAARRARSGTDFFLAGRSIPAWVAGL